MTRLRRSAFIRLKKERGSGLELSEDIKPDSFQNFHATEIDQVGIEVTASDQKAAGNQDTYQKICQDRGSSRIESGKFWEKSDQSCRGGKIHCSSVQSTEE